MSAVKTIVCMFLLISPLTSCVSNKYYTVKNTYGETVKISAKYVEEPGQYNIFVTDRFFYDLDGPFYKTSPK